MTALTVRILRSSTRVLRASVARPALAQMQRRAYAKGDDIGPGKAHATDKPSHDVQAEASQKGRTAREEEHPSEASSHATSQKDAGQHTKRAEDEHPEAPQPVIGMTSERGKKGH